MVPESPDETFRVNDRRRRAPDEEPPPAAAARSAGLDAPAPEAPPRAREAPSLVGLFMTLASSAVVALGDAPDPVTGQRQHDLAGAAGAIDLLLLLRDKTDGHRSADETEVLEELLYDLQLRYVNATKPAGSPAVPPRR